MAQSSDDCDLSQKGSDQVSESSSKDGGAKSRSQTPTVSASPSRMYCLVIFYRISIGILSSNWKKLLRQTPFNAVCHSLWFLNLYLDLFIH